jgi:hypothetical protein
VLVCHFVGAGFASALPGSLEDDLEFLHLVAEKVNAIREDLGSAGPVIATQVEEKMLGRRRQFDEDEMADSSGRCNTSMMEVSSNGRQSATEGDVADARQVALAGAAAGLAAGPATEFLARDR